MSWIASHLTEIIRYAFSVILGGAITLGVNLYLQSRERRKQYAIWNRDNIYSPLYDEIKSIHEKLDSFENPFYATATLNSWVKLSPSSQLRVPPDLTRQIDKFHIQASDYYGAYRDAEKFLDKKVDDVLFEIKDELKEIHDYLKREILDTCKSDFFAGKILKNKRHRLPLESILPIKDGSSLTFEFFFAKVSTLIEGKSEIIELRHKRKQLIEMTHNLENYLESRINYILKKFESKLIRI